MTPTRSRSFSGSGCLRRRSGLRRSGYVHPVHPTYGWETRVGRKTWAYSSRERQQAQTSSRLSRTRSAPTHRPSTTPTLKLRIVRQPLRSDLPATRASIGDDFLARWSFSARSSSLPSQPTQLVSTIHRRRCGGWRRPSLGWLWDFSAARRAPPNRSPALSENAFFLRSYPTLCYCRIIEHRYLDFRQCLFNITPHQASRTF